MTRRKIDTEYFAQDLRETIFDMPTIVTIAGAEVSTSSTDLTTREELGEAALLPEFNAQVTALTADLPANVEIGTRVIWKGHQLKVDAISPGVDEISTVLTLIVDREKMEDDE